MLNAPELALPVAPIWAECIGLVMNSHTHASLMEA